jgi:hypothetical protein
MAAPNVTRCDELSVIFLISSEGVVTPVPAKCSIHVRACL